MATERKLLPFTSAQLTHQRLCYDLTKTALLRGKLALAWQSLQVLLFSHNSALDHSDFVRMLVHAMRTEAQEDMVLEAFRKRYKTEKQALLQIGRMTAKGRWRAAQELVE